MLKNIKINDREKLGKYYDNLDTNQKNKISKIEFLKIFDKNICFIAGFLEGFKKNTRSPYAKYLLVDLNRKLKDLNYNFIILNFGE